MPPRSAFPTQDIQPWRGIPGTCGHVFIKREEVKPLIWRPGYLTSSMVVVVGGHKATCVRTYRSEKGGTKSTPASLRMRFSFRIWTCLELILLQAGSLVTPFWLYIPMFNQLQKVWEYRWFCEKVTFSASSFFIDEVGHIGPDSNSSTQNSSGN